MDLVEEDGVRVEEQRLERDPPDVLKAEEVPMALTVTADEQPLEDRDEVHLDRRHEQDEHWQHEPQPDRFVGRAVLRERREYGGDSEVPGDG